jgi:hypothetical protein
MVSRNDNIDLLDMVPDDESSLMSEHFEGFKKIAENTQRNSQRKIKYMQYLLDFVYLHLSGIVNPLSQDSQSEGSAFDKFQQVATVEKPSGVNYDFENFNEVINQIMELLGNLSNRKNLLEETVLKLSEEKEALAKSNEHLEKVNQELQKKFAAKGQDYARNHTANNDHAKDRQENNQPSDLISETDKDYFLKLGQNPMDTPLKDNSDLDFGHLKQLISANPLINQEDGQSIISKFDRVNRLNDNSRDNSNHSLNTFGKDSGPLAGLVGKQRQFKIDTAEANKNNEVEALLNQMTENFTQIEQLMTPDNELAIAADAKTDLLFANKPLNAENAKKIQMIMHNLKQFPSKIMALIGQNRRQDHELSRVMDNFEKTVHDLNADPSKNAQIINLLEQINIKLGGTNYMTSNPILPVDEPAQLSDLKGNEAMFKKRLDDTMNITFENDVVSEEASKLWKFLFEVMRFKDKDRDSLEFKDPKMLDKINNSVRNRLLRLFGADQNYYDICTLTHCTYYQSVATVLKISLTYLKLCALLVVRLGEYEDNDRIAQIKEKIGEKSKNKVESFEELKSKSVHDLDDFYFLSFGEKIDRLKEANKKVQDIESSELQMAQSLVKLLEAAK